MAADLFYGDSHAGKSAAIERLARHILETTGKKTRVYIGDGGEGTYDINGMVSDGNIELFDYSSNDYPMAIVQMMGDLYWPKDWRKPMSKDNKLVAPSADLFEQYGMLVFEGGQVMGEYLMSDLPGGMRWHAAHKTGFGGVKDESDELSTQDDIDSTYKDYSLHGSASGKHFYVVQKKLLTAIKASKKFPGKVVWTTHPTEAADKTEGGKADQYGKISGKSIIGPDFGGKALASIILKEFNHTFHFDTYTKTVQTKVDGKTITSQQREHRVYTRRHKDPNGQVQTEYMAGIRGPAEILDFYVSKEPGDAVLQVYQALNDYRKKQQLVKEQTNGRI